MDTNNLNEPQTPMQATEAYPLEDRSLRASETLQEQQAEVAEKSSAPVFVP